jgi:type IV secretion system protein VirB6
MYDTLFNFIDVITLTNVTVMSVKMMAVIKPLLGSLVTVYAIYLAYQALFDAQNMMVMESIKFMAALALVSTVALSTPWYLGNIVPIVINSGDDIVNALLSPPSGSTAGTLQLMSNKINIQINTLWDTIDISLTSGASFAHAFLILYQIFYLVLGSVPFLAICTAYLVIAKIMVSFLLIIGPLFIMFSFFPSTRDFFKAWSGQCFNYILLSVLFPIAFSLFGVILDATVFAGVLTTASILSSLVLFIILSFVAVQIPTLTSSLSGGMGINGIVGSLAGVGSGISRLLKNGRGNKSPSKIPKTPKGDSVSAG